MGPKIAAFLITLLLNVAAGVIVFFFMLLAMNGAYILSLTVEDPAPKRVTTREEPFTIE